MPNNGKNKRVRAMIILILIIVVLSLSNLIFGRESTAFEKMVKDTMQTVEYYVIKKPIQFFQDIGQEISDMINVYEENELLKEQLDEYAKTQARVDALEDEIDQLKEQLDLDSIPSDYLSKNTYIISRDVESWNNQVLINLGVDDGVEENMAVVNSEGMIGYISSVNEYTSTVTLLTTEKVTKQIPIMVEDVDGNNVYGLLTGYDSNTGYLEIEMFSSAEFEEGTKIYTSGLGGDIPSGILIGTVANVTVASNQLNPTIEAESAADFSALRYVSVVQRGDADEGDDGNDE